MMEEVYLGLGSNLGDREDNIRKALSLLQEKARLKAISSLYDTVPQYIADQPDFLNAVCCVITVLDPFQLLAFVEDIEIRLGRTPTFPKGPRVIDIDVLLYGDLTLETPSLTVPHPGLAERAFVLVPLVEIAPEVVHPILREKASALLQKLGSADGIRLWSPPSNQV